jgi:hypothetical protein
LHNDVALDGGGRSIVDVQFDSSATLAATVGEAAGRGVVMVEKATAGEVTGGGTAFAGQPEGPAQAPHDTRPPVVATSPNPGGGAVGTMMEQLEKKRL